MPTTNISQIISDVIDSVRFFRIEQRRFVAEYSKALFLSSYKNTKRIANFCSSSQSSISRMLSSQSLSTRDLSYARVEYISRFLQKNSLEFKYIILDETVMKRRGKRIGNLGKFYSTIENRIVSGISLLSAIGWVKNNLYFPLFSSLRDEENLTDQFVRLMERIPFKDTILMMDGGIVCRSVKDQVYLRDFFEEIKSNYSTPSVQSLTISSASNFSFLFLLPRFFNSKCIS